MQNFRATRNADTALTLYVRDDDGRLDMGAVETITLAIHRYGVPAGDPLDTVAGANPTVGKITATINSEVADELGPGLYRLDTLADDALLRSDVLEVV
jgi:hypothetical protein